MNMTVVRVLFSLLWLVIGLVLVFRERLFPETSAEDWGQTNWTLPGILAIAFAGWNLFRAFVLTGKPAAPRARPVVGRRPLQPRDARPTEYIPELDFTKPAPPPEGKG